MKYGLIWGIFDKLDSECINSLLQLHNSCDRLVIGLFSDEIAIRITGNDDVLEYEKRKQFILHHEYVENVVKIDAASFSVQAFCNLVCEIIGGGYDSLVVGLPPNYGIVYGQEKKWCEQNGISCIEYDSPVKLDTFPLSIALSNEFVDYNIVLFGTGKYFDKYMSEFGTKYPPAYAIDNNSELWGKCKSSVLIKNPQDIISDDSKDLLVIICAKNSDKMLEQVCSFRNIDYRLMTCGTEQVLYKEWQIILEKEHMHLDKCHRILLELLTEFDRVCTKYGVRYFLSCGSAIGAVRHHGFIPWDDDVDVSMYQEDFDILKEHAQELWPEGSDYRLVCPEDLGNGAFLDFLNRLMCVREHADTNTFDKVKGKADSYVQRTANLDIYILNRASVNASAQKRNALILRAIYGLGMGHRAYINFDTYRNTSLFTRFVIRTTSTIGKLIPLKLIIRLHEKCARRYDKTDSTLCFESNGYVTDQIFEREMFGDGKRIKVCNKEFMVARDVERYLEEHGYHDFMTYPPVSKRRPTHALKSPDLV